MVREVSIESYLKKAVEKTGGLCLKLSPANYVGIPDRLVILPGGVIVFVELKRPRGGIIAPMQERWRDMLVRLGCRHAFVNTREGVDSLMEKLRV
jgi:hypothetical protein